MVANSIFKILIQKHSSEIGNSVAFLNFEKVISYKSLEAFSLKAEIFFKKNKLSPQSPILIYLPQAIELALLVSSLLYSGVPALIVPAGMKAYEVDQILSGYPFAGVVTSNQLGAKLNIPDTFQLEEMNIEDFKFSFYKMIEEKKISITFNWLLMTSGSTGKSKIVMMTIENLLKRTLGEVKLFEVKSQSKLLNILPFSHDIGLNQLLVSIYTGSRLEIFTKKLPMEFANRMVEGGLDGVSSMPQIWNNFIQIAKKLKLKIDHKGYITVSGGSLPVERLIELREIFINAKIFKTYGQTETFRSLAETDQNAILKNSCGKVLTDVQLLLVNENDQLCLAGESGQLIHIGAGTMSGYWLDQELTESKMKSIKGINAPLVRTGDYFIMSEDGRFQYEGRKDDMIKHAGRRFFLSEVEACIRTSDLVKDVFLTHVTDENFTSFGREKIVAFVIPKEDVENVSTDLKAHCTCLLETFKVPNEFIICSAFPMTSNFKVDRLALLKLGRLSGNK